MHFSVLLIHESEESSIMAKHNCDATEDDGAEITFEVEYTAKQAKKLYKNTIKEVPEIEKTYPTLAEFMEGEYSHLDLKYGEYGNSYNSDSMYDWCEVGGRWKNILPTCKSEEELKALLKKALNLKDEKVAEKYRDNVQEYVKISEMELIEACSHLELDGQSEMLISEDISAQDIINKFKAIQKSWNENMSKEDAVKRMICNIIIEDENGDEETYYEGDENINEKFLIEKYNYFLNLNKTEDRNFQITILDCHI